MNRRDFIKLIPFAPVALTATTKAEAPKPSRETRYYDGDVVFWRGMTFGIRGTLVVWSAGECASIPKHVGFNWWRSPHFDVPIALSHCGDDLLCEGRRCTWRLKADLLGEFPFVASLERVR